MVDLKGFKFLNLPKWIPATEDKNLQIWMREICYVVFNKWLLNYYISEESVWTGKGLKDKRQGNDVLTLKLWKG